MIILDIRTSIATLPALAPIALKNSPFYMIRNTLRIRILLKFNKMPFPDAYSSANNSNCQGWVRDIVETSS